MSHRIEEQIIASTLQLLLDSGCKVEIAYHGYIDKVDRNAIVAVYEGDGMVRVKSCDTNSWICFIVGNGVDVLSDHGINLENMLKPIYDLCDWYHDADWSAPRPLPYINLD